MLGICDLKRNVDKILEDKSAMKNKLSEKESKKHKTHKIDIEEV